MSIACANVETSGIASGWSPSWLRAHGTASLAHSWVSGQARTEGHLEQHFVPGGATTASSGQEETHL